MIVAWALPAAGYAISAMVWGPTGPNLATAFLIFPVAMLGSAVVRDGLVDRLPLARGEVFEALAGAVFVTDRLGRVIDVNAAARALARDIDGVEDISGRILEEVCPETARILDRGGEADVPGTGGDRVVSMLSTPIVDGRGETVGRCVIVRDVTESVIQRRELERTRDALSYEVTVSEELRAELGNQVMRDSATGLYNRRYLAHILPEIVASSVADGSALSVAVFDIDDFKIVNDSHGHVAGDRVIEAVATALRVNAPGGTVVRYGGDEFLALLPGLTAREALAVTNSMRAACAVVRVDTRDGEVGVTVSAGVATLIGEEVNADELLEVADLALYRAKNTGRDRTWSPVEDPA
jgi:diguanylate cyclase (GGDEF)-like protein